MFYGKQKYNLSLFQFPVKRCPLLSHGFTLQSDLEGIVYHLGRPTRRYPWDGWFLVDKLGD